MPAAPIALIAAAGAVSAFGQVMQGIHGQQSSDRVANQYERAAQQANWEAGTRIAKGNADAMAVISRGRVNAAASGVTSSGSPSIVEASNVNKAILDEAYTRYSGKLMASQDLYAASMAKWQGKQEFNQGLIGAGGTLLTAGFKMYGAGK